MNNLSTCVRTIGMDLSDKHITACELTEHGVLEETAKFVSTKKKLISRYGSMDSCRIVMEAGSHTRWIAELLTELGHTVMVLDPRRLALITSSLKKTDVKDAERLAWLGQQFPDKLYTVQLRTEAHQIALSLVRTRDMLVKQRTAVVNNLRGGLKPYGFRIPKSGTAKTFAEFVRKELRDDVLDFTECSLVVLGVLNEQIKVLDKKVETMLAEIAPDAMNVLSIKGVGALTLLYFIGIVGDPHRFSDTRAVGAFIGLTRRQNDSGAFVSELGITKCGDPLMRKLLSNCASYILGHFGPDSDLRTWGLKLAGDGNKGQKKKAKVAVARKLAVLMLTLWKRGDVYDPFHHSNPVDQTIPALPTPAAA